MVETLLPSAPRWSLRADADRAPSRASPGPRWRGRGRAGSRPRAPATAARMTSLTVPPSSFLTCFRSASEARTQAKRRCGPMSTLNGVCGAPMPARASEPGGGGGLCQPRDDARRGPRSDAAGAPNDLARADQPLDQRLARSCGALGSGSGIHCSRGGAVSGGSFSRSKRTVVMSTPETPSTMQWWVLATIAKRPPSSPSTSQSSQSGFERSSCWEKTRAARFRSCSSLPGAGQGGVADVVVEVEVGVVDPDGAALAERGRSGASGGSGARGAGARRCGRGTRRSRGRGPRRGSSRRRACAAPSCSRCRNEVSRPVRRSAMQ